MSIFRLKQNLTNPVDCHGVWYFKLDLFNQGCASTYLTRLDQALIVWAVAIAAIFFIAQFYPLNWKVQAVVWSILSCIAVWASGKLAWFWVTARQKRWILYCWSCLVLGGLYLTDYGIFTEWGILLVHLCSIWLGISAIGYFATGIGMRAPALSWIGIVHVGAIPILSLFPIYQFLLAGIVMFSSLFCLAAFEWQHQ